MQLCITKLNVFSITFLYMFQPACHSLFPDNDLPILNHSGGWVARPWMLLDGCYIQCWSVLDKSFVQVLHSYSFYFLFFTSFASHVLHPFVSVPLHWLFCSFTWTIVLSMTKAMISYMYVCRSQQGIIPESLYKLQTS